MTFLSSDNLLLVLASFAPLFILAAGQTVVLISGGIDLSMTSVMAMASVTGAALMRAGQPIAAGVAAMLLVGAGIGLLHGLAVSRLRLPPFMVTLIGMMFFSGLAIWSTQSKNITGLPADFGLMGRTLLAVSAMATFVGVVTQVLLQQCVFGRRLRALGFNQEAAHASGVPVAAVTTGAYVVSGLCAAVAAVIYSARLETGSPVLGQRMLLDVVGAAVIGGVSLFGGRGQVWQALLGAAFFAALDNALALAGLSHFRIMMIKGGVILSAAAIDARRRLYGTS
jgi:ribose/xylose/arabinose/galactoside ABC-type transport system permease subunit